METHSGLNQTPLTIDLSTKVCVCLLVGLTVFSHATYINNGFTWLDHGDIEAGRAVLPLSQLADAFFARFGSTGFYRPLVSVFHSIDAAIFGNWAPGFHLTNLLLHVAATLAASVFLKYYFLLTTKESLLASLVFGIHPISWLPVGAVSYRPELLVVLFSLLSCIYYLQYRLHRRTLHGVLSLCFLASALLSKETAIFWIPSLILLWEITRPTTAHQKIPVLFWVAAAAVILVYLSLRMHAVPETWRIPYRIQFFSEILGTRLAALGTVLYWLVNPLKPPLSDAISVVGIGNIVAIATAGLLIVAALLVIRLGRFSVYTKTLLFLGILVLPAFNIVPAPRFKSPHYAYFAVLAMGVLLILLLRAVRNHSKLGQNIAYLLSVLWLLTMAWSSFVSGQNFKDDLHLFEKEVAFDQNFREGHYYLGVYFTKIDKLKRAEQEFDAALQRDSKIIAYVDSHSLLINTAGVRVLQGRLAEADELLVQAIPGSQSRHRQLIAYNRALIALKQGRNQDVVDLLAPYTNDWDKPEPLLLYARSLDKTGRTKDAVLALRKVLPLVKPAKRSSIERLILELEKQK